jgi:hypothetical protein
VAGGVSVKPPQGLTPAARAAYSRAERELAEDAVRYRTALLSYTYAVDLESRARAEWVRESRPLVQVHGAAGVHPLVKVMLETSRSAAYHGAQLGMDPASAKRINPHRRPGRPVGANSAPDRRELPGPLYAVRTADGLPPIDMASEPPRFKVNRARGHHLDD